VTLPRAVKEMLYELSCCTAERNRKGIVSSELLKLTASSVTKLLLQDSDVGERRWN
jgi:hypothetical protein